MEQGFSQGYGPQSGAQGAMMQGIPPGQGQFMPNQQQFSNQR